jgi:hypothetical protein
MLLNKNFFVLPFLITAGFAAVRRPDGEVYLSPNLNNLTSVLVTSIGSYLTCPHRVLPLVCKSLATVYIHDFPYNKEVANRFNIPELFSAETFKDLGFFLDLKLIPDKLTKFHLLMNHLFFHSNTFKDNSKALAWHVYKIYKEIPLEYKRSATRQQIFDEFMPNLVNFLLKYEAFDLLVKICKTDPQEFTRGIDKFQFKDAMKFFKELKESSEAANGVLNYETINSVLTKLFQVLEVASNNDIFFNALFIGTPLDFYGRAAHKSSIEFLKKCFIDFLMKFHVRRDYYEICFLRVQNFIDEFIEDGRKRFFNLLNTVRFKPEIEVNQNQEIGLVFDDIDSFFLFLTASTACRNHLIHATLSNHKSFIIDMYKTYPEAVTIKSICDLLPFLTVGEQSNLLSYDADRFTKLLLSKIAISRIEFISHTNSSFLELKPGQDLIRIGIPPVLVISTNLSEWYLINNCTFIDSRSLYYFFEYFSELPSHMTLFENDDRGEITPKLETTKMILRNRNICIKIDYLEYCFSIYVQSDHDLVEVLKTPSAAYNLQQVYSPQPFNMIYLLSKGDDKNYFDRLESHFKDYNGGNLVGFINSLNMWDYGEIRHVLFYLLKNEERKLELLNLSDSMILKLLEEEAPEEVASLRA